jgi:hypothetical protein
MVIVNGNLTSLIRCTHKIQTFWALAKFLVATGETRSATNKKMGSFFPRFCDLESAEITKSQIWDHKITNHKIKSHFCDFVIHRQPPTSQQISPVEITNHKNHKFVIIKSQNEITNHKIEITNFCDLNFVISAIHEKFGLLLSSRFWADFGSDFAPIRKSAAK